MARTTIYRGHEGFRSEEQHDAPTAPAADDLNSLTVADLQQKADDRGVTVEGTGKGGRVTKADLINALEGGSDGGS